MSNATIVGMEITGETINWHGGGVHPTTMCLDLRMDTGTTARLDDLPFRPVRLGDGITLTVEFEEVAE